MPELMNSIEIKLKMRYFCGTLNSFQMFSVNQGSKILNF